MSLNYISIIVHIALLCSVLCIKIKNVQTKCDCEVKGPEPYRYFFIVTVFADPYCKRKI